jgi:sec-independent protein translocase protein TatA
MANLGFTEIVIILLILILLFGGKKIPTIAKNIGEGIRQFRKTMNSDNDKDKK